MVLGLFIPLTLCVLVAVFVASFKEEFDRENLNSVWLLVGLGFILLLLGSVFASF